MPTLKYLVQSGGVLLVALIAIFVTSMVADGITPALPVLQRELHASTNSMGWFYTAPMLSAVVTLPLIGKLAEIFSRRRILFVILFIVFVGMLLSALADSAPLLIFGQILSGLSLSLFPLSVGIIRDSCAPEKVGPANAVVGSLGAVAPMIGLLACGPIIDHFSYKWLFWGPAIALAFCLVLMLILPTKQHHAPTLRKVIDWSGALFLSMALGSGLLAISRISENAWSDSGQIALFLISLASILIWFVHEKRTTEPLIDLSFFSNRTVLGSGLCMLVAGYVIVSVSVAVPVYAEFSKALGGLGATVGETSSYFLAMSLAGMAITPIIDVAEQHIGSRHLLFIAMLLLAATPWAISTLPMDNMSVLIGMGVIGAAFTVVLVESMNVIAANFTADQVTEISGLTWVMKSFGATLGSQVSACIMALGDSTSNQIPSVPGIFHSLSMTVVVGIAGFLFAILMPRRRGKTN